MISSVVPVKLPVMRGLYVEFHAVVHDPNFASVFGCGGTVWFATVFSGRGSHDDRRTRAAHSASDGNADPAGVIEKYPPAAGFADEPLGAGAGNDVVVVDVVVDALVGVDGCCGRVVVVVDVGAIERGGLVVATVVATRQRRWCRSPDHRRRAEATGTEMASTRVTAIDTTTNVRSLRLILYPFFDGWESPRRPRTEGGIDAGARREAPCVATAEPGVRGTGLEPPAGAGPEHARSRANSCECDVTAISG
jgi:hypothetical protein